MKRFFTVYTLTDCQFCKKAINLLDQRNLSFIVVVMDRNPEFVQKLKQDMNHPTVPVIVEHLNMGIKVIGGSDNLEAYLNSPEFVND
jgi:glutaredoxin